MAVNTEKCCNFCKNSTIRSIGYDERSRYNLYCNFDDHTKMVDLSVPREGYVEKPIWCPLMKNSSNKETTKSAPLTYNEKVSLMNKIQPKIRWCDIEEGKVYHVPQFPGEERKDILITRKNEHSLAYREINGASNVIYTVYPTSLMVRFLVEHKIKEFKPIQKT